MSRRILIADDNQDTIEMLQVLLGEYGWEVLGAGTAAEAKARINAEPFDLVILDRRLPDGDGVDLCRDLRSDFPGLPVIFLSGAVLPSDFAMAAEAGCDAYLVKPCSVDKLTEVVKQLVNVDASPEVGSPGC